MLIRYPDSFYEFPSLRATYSITINRSARKLTLFKNRRYFKSYPIAVGKGSTPTPKGNFKIINKQINPGGPYGARWMGLSTKGVGIHGTNNPGSIGGPVSWVYTYV